MVWSIGEKDLKKYPHFDNFCSASTAFSYVTAPEKIVRHPFFPFIEYLLQWNKWSPKGSTGKKKTRKIRYAARLDSYIFSYYRHELSQLYEARLGELCLSRSVLAYRSIKDTDGKGKSNINHAKDAFDAISKIGHCTVFALDISQFF